MYGNAREQTGSLDLIIISDLHLSEGRDRRTKRFSLNEGFFFDTSFRRFLEYLHREGERNGRKWRLIIAGDMIDFLQITSLPEADEITEGLGFTPQDITPTERQLWGQRSRRPGGS